MSALGKMALKAVLTEHAVETAPAAEVPTLREVLQPSDLARLSRLNREAERVPEKPPRWRSARAALLAWAYFEADGAIAKSPSAPVARAIDEARGSAGVLERDEPVRHDQRGADWTVEVDDAIDGAFPSAWVLTTYPARVELGAAMCRAVMLASVVGKLITPSANRRPDFDRARGDLPGEDHGGAKARKRSVGSEWVEQDADTVIGEVKERTGIVLTVGDVERITRAGLYAVAKHLAGCGLVPQPKERDMGLVQDAADLEGWKDIAKALGVSVATAQRWARRDVRPMPVGAIGGKVRASTAKLQAWVQETFAGATPSGT